MPTLVGGHTWRGLGSMIVLRPHGSEGGHVQLTLPERINVSLLSSMSSWLNSGNFEVIG